MFCRPNWCEVCWFGAFCPLDNQQRLMIPHLGVLFQVYLASVSPESRKFRRMGMIGYNGVGDIALNLNIYPRLTLCTDVFCYSLRFFC